MRGAPVRNYLLLFKSFTQEGVKRTVFYFLLGANVDKHLFH